MLNFLRKKKNNIFVEQISAVERNKIIAVFYKNLSELYASNAIGLKIPCGNFDLIKNRFYFEVAKEILKLLKTNIRIDKYGEDAKKPDDRYFLISIVVNASEQNKRNTPA